MFATSHVVCRRSLILFGCAPAFIESPSRIFFWCLLRVRAAFSGFILIISDASEPSGSPTDAPISEVGRSADERVETFCSAMAAVWPIVALRANDGATMRCETWTMNRLRFASGGVSANSSIVSPVAINNFSHCWSGSIVGRACVSHSRRAVAHSWRSAHLVALEPGQRGVEIPFEVEARVL